MNKYQNYYFQNDKVRLRLWEPGDEQYDTIDTLDSMGMSLVREEMPLPSQQKDFGLEGYSTESITSVPSFTIMDLEDGYIGYVRFNYINERHGTFSIGLFLTASKRGKGFGKSTMSLMLQYAFEERRLHKFEGYCLQDNIASAKMMESLGCILEGVSRECVFLKGSYHNRCSYGMTEEEYWKSKKN